MVIRRAYRQTNRVRGVQGMPKRMLILVMTAIMVFGAVNLYADMVILKSGEMFQTPKAWTKDNRVFMYRDGKITSIEARDVERVIHHPTPDGHLPESRDPSTVPAPPDSQQVTGETPPMRPSEDDAAGFRGLRWGMPPAQVEGLKQVGIDPDYGGVEQYVQVDRGQRFGRAKVDRVVLGFWQGGLYTIVVEVSNFLDFRELKAEAFRRFGKWRQREVDVEKGYWVDAGSDRLLAYDVNSDTGYLWMRSRVLHHRVTARYPD